MSPESAEMTKYVANALLATKISFINEMANLCEHMEADINDVRRGIGHDSRIGFAFLFPGVGYGGSCFPEGRASLVSMAQNFDVEPRILASVDDVNTRQKQVLHQKIAKFFAGNLKGKTIAIWGLAFKPRTDDIREAPALGPDRSIAGRRRKLHVHDPEGMENVRRITATASAMPSTPTKHWTGRMLWPSSRNGSSSCARLRRNAQADEDRDRFRRAESVRAQPDESSGIHVPLHRPGPGQPVTPSATRPTASQCPAIRTPEGRDRCGALGTCHLDASDPRRRRFVAIRSGLTVGAADTGREP